MTPPLIPTFHLFTVETEVHPAVCISSLLQQRTGIGMSSRTSFVALWPRVRLSSERKIGKQPDVNDYTRDVLKTRQRITEFQEEPSNTWARGPHEAKSQMPDTSGGADNPIEVPGAFVCMLAFETQSVNWATKYEGD
ncbi:uncharacterized protein BJ212DRAFT_1303981 [Suillus subaureus]|uniref:Uncharacterized protein n=1 Tax=Suillus subaureus TaxID=48587 RepID=A0A9P7J6X8_9AGAM|nr:uncharacterized protein BJ212DRAFT_1303981 [Suillus subaureus]KAG1805725.1 hypothetical protein BJ212DRAFT_1303981 [Suillus subaureus]